MKHPLTRIIGVVLVAFALVAAGCGDDDTTSTSGDVGSGGTTDTTIGDGIESTSVTIYSGRTEDLVQPILDEFEAATGIEVNVRYGDSADLALLIEEEAAASNVQADVFLSQSPGSLGFLEAQGRLAVIPDDVLGLVPDTVRDGDGRWIGFSGRQRVLVYNPELVSADELPASVLDLTDERWKGRIGIAPSNGSFQDFVTAMRVIEGDETTTTWLEGMAANDAVPYPKNSAIVEAVGRGEVDAGLVNHYYNFRAVAENPDHPALNHQFAGDDSGSILIVTGAAIIDGAGAPDAAAALIEFLLGESGQRYFADETFEYPLASGVAPATVIPAIDFENVGDIDYERLGDDLASTREMIADAGLEG